MTVDPQTRDFYIELFTPVKHGQSEEYSFTVKLPPAFGLQLGNALKIILLIFII